VTGFDEQTLESLVTEAAARLLRLTDRGVLRTGARADLLVLPARLPFSRATRKDIRLIMLGGNMCCGARDLAEVMLPRSQRSEIRIDGCAKVVTARLGALLGSIGARESGLEPADAAGRAA
jgi:N-acyl-D-aspartate/D-glutamate deacylase